LAKDVCFCFNSRVLNQLFETKISVQGWSINGVPRLLRRWRSDFVLLTNHLNTLHRAWSCKRLVRDSILRRQRIGIRPRTVPRLLGGKTRQCMRSFLFTASWYKDCWFIENWKWYF
jgi:hypothetical protein